MFNVNFWIGVLAGMSCALAVGQLWLKNRRYNPARQHLLWYLQQIPSTRSQAIDYLSTFFSSEEIAAELNELVQKGMVVTIYSLEQITMATADLNESGSLPDPESSAGKMKVTARGLKEYNRLRAA